MINVSEIAPDVYRLSVFVKDFNLQFNHFLIKDDEPMLYHAGMRQMFPLLLEAVSKIMPPSEIRWIGFSHFEVDECGALNDWLEVAPNAQAVCSEVGAIVNMASCAGLVGWENATAYVASKHAVVGLTKTLGLEFGARGIRINAVCPSFVVTAMTDAILESPEVEAGAVAKHPIGRLGKPGEIAEAVVYLLSSRASFMSGSSMVVDGGYSAQ